MFQMAACACPGGGNCPKRPVLRVLGSRMGVDWQRRCPEPVNVLQGVPGRGLGAAAPKRVPTTGPASVREIDNGEGEWQLVGAWQWLGQAFLSELSGQKAVRASDTLGQPPQFTLKPMSHLDLYEIHTAPLRELINGALSAEQIIELARLRDLL